MSDAESPKGTMELSCEDCMALMARYPDKHFDLAIVDPPYGIGICNQKTGRNNGKNYVATEYSMEKRWDEERPGPEYFTELRRVSRDQIIWGGNYFADMLPPSRGMIFWDKMIGDNDFSGGELAWTSFDRPLKIVRHYHGGNRVSNNAEAAKAYARIHPTQKPVALYRWLLERYAKPGQRILDTHLGSGSHAIAAHYFGAHLTACEIDADYFAAATARIQRETAQTTFL
jgi:site-specific DNA-methyltransferase (adenine-specific)